MIKAIIFDFFGVISSDYYWRFVKEDKDYDGGFHDIVDDVNLGKISWDVLVQKTVERTGQTAETVHQMFESQKINPKVLMIIADLHKKYKTALLTNAHEAQFEPIVKRAALDQYFDHIIISSKLGMIKPNPRIFIHVLDKLSVAPEEAVFIDDIKRYVDAAKLLGINTIHFQNVNQLKKDLSSLLKTAPTDN